MSAAAAPNPRDLCRAVEDLRYSHIAIVMAASGIAADLNAKHRDGDGVYFLLMALAEQMDRRLAALEKITGCA